MHDSTEKVARCAREIGLVSAVARLPDFLFRVSYRIPYNSRKSLFHLVVRARHILCKGTLFGFEPTDCALCSSSYPLCMEYI
jgi:hypothetical protein